MKQLRGLKNIARCVRIRNKCTGRSSIGEILAFLYGALSNFSEHLGLNNDFKCFIHVDRVLNRAAEANVFSFFTLE